MLAVLEALVRDILLLIRHTPASGRADSAGTAWRRREGRALRMACTWPPLTLGRGAKTAGQGQMDVGYREPWVALWKGRWQCSLRSGSTAQQL